MVIAAFFSFLILFSWSLVHQRQVQNQESKMLVLYQKAFKEKIDKESEKALLAFQSLPSKQIERPNQAVRSDTLSSQAKTHFKGKINLYNLLSQTPHTPLYQSLFCSFIQQHYSKSLHLPPNFAQRVLKELLHRTTFKKSERNQKFYLQKVEDLAEFEFEDQSLQPFFYQILKGTKVLGFEGGTMPISHFLTLHKWSQTQINLHSASFELLTSLYNEETAHYIMKNRKLWKKGTLSAQERAQTILNEIERIHRGEKSPYRSIINYRFHSK